MEILRAHSPKGVGYTTLTNSVIEDETLGSDALGVLAYLLSKPPGWIIRASDLKRRFGFGEFKRLSILRNLQEAHYLVRQSEQDEKGQICWRYEIHELPQDRLDFDLYRHRRKAASGQDPS